MYVFPLHELVLLLIVQMRFGKQGRISLSESMSQNELLFIDSPNAVQEETTSSHPDLWKYPYSVH